MKGRYVKLDSAKMRWHRDRLGWTLDTLAKHAEVAEGTALRAEHGEDIRPSSGRRIARALGVDTSELVPDRPGVVLPKATAPSTSGLPEAKKYKIELGPTGTGPVVTREALAEHGISVTDAELSTLNIYLEGLQQARETGEPSLMISVAGDNVDHQRIELLATYVLTTPGMLAPGEAEAVRQGVRKTLVAASR